jgi:hypothetical protein
MVPNPDTELDVSVVTFMLPNSALSALTLPETVSAEPETGAVLMAIPPLARTKN